MNRLFPILWLLPRESLLKLQTFLTHLNQKMRAGEQFLFEGAQGTMLDIDHGTYPYVTSSNTVAGSASPGAGVGPQKPQLCFGYYKSVLQHVSEKVRSQQNFDDDGKKLREKGNEFGVVTGRPRRCGWFDGAAFKTFCKNGTVFPAWPRDEA